MKTKKMAGIVGKLQPESVRTAPGGALELLPALVPVTEPPCKTLRIDAVPESTRPRIKENGTLRS